MAVLSWLASIGVLAWGARRQGVNRNVPGMLLCGLLAFAFFASVALSFAPPPRWFLAAPEFAVIAVAARIAHDFDDDRARVVALLGIGKLGLRWAWSEGHLDDHTIYAATLNGAFLVQCLTAGGFLDAVGTSIADRWRALFRGAGRGRANAGGA